MLIPNTPCESSTRHFAHVVSGIMTLSLFWAIAVIIVHWWAR